MKTTKPVRDRAAALVLDEFRAGKLGPATLEMPSEAEEAYEQD